MVSDLIKDLQERSTLLASVKKDAISSLKKLPKGSLRLGVSKGKPRYYKVNKQNKRGKYIKASDIGVAQGLAQADYLRKVLKATNDEITKIEGMIRFYSKGTMEDIADKLHPVRKNLIMWFTYSV